MTPLHGARAAIAGALTMLLGGWLMLADHSTWTEREVVIAIVAFLAIVLLLLGVDIRRSQRHDGDKD